MRQADVQTSMQRVAGDRNMEKATALRTYDAAAVQARMAKLYAEVKQRKADEAQRAAELRAVAVSEDDVALLAAQLSLDADEARRRLQAKAGDVTAVLRECVGLPKQREGKKDSAALATAATSSSA